MQPHTREDKIAPFRRQVIVEQHACWPAWSRHVPGNHNQLIHHLVTSILITID